MIGVERKTRPSAPIAATNENGDVSAWSVDFRQETNTGEYLCW